MPGDHKNAWDYWGLDCAVDAATCNGNGDYKITESLMFWRHLTLSSILPGNYKGFWDTNPAPLGVIRTLKDNVLPKSSINGAFYGVWGWLPKNIILLGGLPCGLSALLCDKVISPTDAKYIDNKIDDGTG